MIHWTDISFLNRGTDRQRDAYLALIELDLFSVLVDFDPVLVGTLPLGIEAEQSDIEIICEAGELGRLADILERLYGYYDDFETNRERSHGHESLVCTFRFRDFSVEVFAQDVPTDEQVAYKHMVAESRLLQLAGDEAEASIRELKMDGMKTEPAFGHYFHLEGDPYEVLSELADASTEDLMAVLERANRLRYGGMRTYLN